MSLTSSDGGAAEQSCCSSSLQSHDETIVPRSGNNNFTKNLQPLTSSTRRKLFTRKRKKSNGANIESSEKSESDSLATAAAAVSAVSLTPDIRRTAVKSVETSSTPTTPSTAVKGANRSTSNFQQQQPEEMTNKRYNLVEDNSDLKIPLHSDAAFNQGIIFKAKFIGMGEVSKPSSRSEIVSLMRKIRFDFKVKTAKKIKANICVTSEHVKVEIRFDKKRSAELRPLMLHCHSINKIFYVSHDSQDGRIFSYIARDAKSFGCYVYKATKREEAMYIVRTIGQAFEVGHKRAIERGDVVHPQQPPPQPKMTSTPSNSVLISRYPTTTRINAEFDRMKSTPKLPILEEAENLIEEVTSAASGADSHTENGINSMYVGAGSTNDLSGSEISERIIKSELDLQRQQMSTLVGELQFIREQLTAEQTAKIEAQSRLSTDPENPEMEDPL